MSRRPLSKVPSGTIPFNLFKTEVCFQIANDIFAGITYPSISFVSGVKTIVDIGANVGAASVYFAMAYPEARSMPSNLEALPCPCCSKNVAPLRNVKVFPFGLHSRERDSVLISGQK